MRTTLATMCVLLLLGGCERRGDRETAAELDRSDSDTVTTTAADTTEAARDTPEPAVDTSKPALDWQPAPPFLPAGARAAVLEGDPGKPGPFRIRLEMPEGYEVRPHHHPMSEQIRVLEGILLLGRGKDWDDKKLDPLAVGDEATVAAKMPHYVRAGLRTVIDLKSTGPFEITYIEPADDPRKAPAQ
jgi:hypothetical protein